MSTINGRTCGVSGYLSTTNYYGGTASLMPGGNTSFLAGCIVRDLASTATTQHLWGNYNDPAGADNFQGWRFLRVADTAGPPRFTNYTVEVYGGATTLSATVAIPKANSLGRCTHLMMCYVSGTDLLSFYVNGALVATDTDTITPLASVLAPTIGGTTVVSQPASTTSVLAAAYTTTFVDTTQATIDGWVSSSYLESLKRAEIAGVTGLSFEYNYSMANDCGYSGVAGGGYPRTLLNQGSAGISGNLTKAGVSAFTVGVFPYIMSCLSGVPDI